MNHLYEAVNFQTRGGKKKEALVDLIWSILCVSSARRQTPHTWYGGIFLPLSCSALLTCHMGAVSLPIALPLYYKPARL